MEDKAIIKFIVSAALSQDPERSIKLSEPLVYQIENIKTTIINNPEDDSKLSLTLEIDTTDTERAKFIAENEVLRVANLLSWEKSIPLTNPRVGAMHYSTKPGNMNAIGFVETLHMSVRMSMNVTLNTQGIQMLSKKLADCSGVPDEVQLMWREAISESSKSLQFLLYFRILEYIQGKRSKADVYIKEVEPTVRLEKGQYGEDISIYTYLRDNIHAKNPSFPYKDIERYLPKLSGIVRNAIESTYPSNLP
jgi:hypothetical protein